MIVEKIYHLADLHIRNLKRHKEYRLVFEKFLENVKTDDIENSVIYLAGDIAHAKTEMSPELVREISWFLTECAKLKHTFLITGNHDCNLNNDYRLDVLTPIVENLNNDRIHYLKDTGVYPFHNITFVVYSILDKKENWPKAELVEGENTICLFHGPVNKAQTDVGYTVSSNSFTIDMFDGFDMVMLGDIHKRQTFGENYEHVAYAGSMIQQNHGELLEKHGYLLWDVKSRTFEEFHLHNDYGYLTIDVVDGKIPQWVYDEIDTKLPKYPRLRLRFTRTEPSDTKRCVTELKKLFKVSEVTVTRTDTIGQLKTNQNVNQNIVGNVKDETFQNQLIRDYLERQFLLDGDELDKIGEINKEINSQVDDTKVAENVLWVPKTFEFSNMFSYGEGNKIRFDNAQGIMGIFAPNASGKSSLFDALSFCIFDKSSRTFLSKNILNNRKDWFHCKFHFQINDVDYYIERKAKKINKGKSVKVDVNFWSESGGVITSLNGEQRRDTNTIINQYLGSYDDFVLTALSLQGNNALFIDKSQSERKEILSQFIGVDIFDKLYQRASEEFKDTTTLIKKFKRDDFTSKLADIDTNLVSKKNEYKISTATNEGLRQEEEKLNKQIISLNEKIVKLGMDDSSESIDDLNNALETLTKNRDTIIKSKESLQKRINEKEEVQIKLEEKIDTMDEDTITNEFVLFNQYTLDLKDLDNELDKLKIKEDSLIERMKHLESHKYNPDCDICMENSESIIDAKVGVESDLATIAIEKNEKLEEKNRLLLAIDTRKKYKKLNEELTKLISDEEKVSRDINTLINKLSTTETQEARLDAQVTEQEKIIQEYIKNEQTIEKNREIRSQISNIRTNLSNVKNELKINNTNVLKLNGQVSSLQNQKETIEERIREVRELEEQHGLFQYYLNALGKDGVSYELISKALPMIEGEVNNILTQIVEFGMQLEMDGKNINAYIVYDDQKWSLEMCSGMERFISGLAIRIALINVCNLPRPNFLVIDEGFGTLDNENLTSLYMLFTYLKTQFDFVMIISHIDSMRDVVDSLMEIKKVNGFSSIKL
jgi:DNA repair exonuclease SbcCD ATPase subunit/DNA repair exonuclease SbcCD nuclease subunit